MKKSILLPLALLLTSQSLLAGDLSSKVTGYLSEGTSKGIDAEGNSCSVNLTIYEGNSTITVLNKNSAESITLLGSDLSISVSEDKIVSRQKLNAPRYVGGGSRLLKLEKNSVGDTVVLVSRILLDHNGNDASEYLTCLIQK